MNWQKRGKDEGKERKVLFYLFPEDPFGQRCSAAVLLVLPPRSKTKNKRNEKECEYVLKAKRDPR